MEEGGDDAEEVDDMNKCENLRKLGEPESRGTAQGVDKDSRAVDSPAAAGVGWLAGCPRLLHRHPPAPTPPWLVLPKRQAWRG